MADYGSPNYKVGLIIVRAQPLHNGHIRAIMDAIVKCDEVIVSVRDYDTSFFDYNIAQKLFRNLFGKKSDRVAFFGTLNDPLLGTPKLVINKTLEILEIANYHMPDYFFSYDDLWIDGARELNIIPVKIGKLGDTDSNLIYQSVVDGTDYWKSRVPHALIEDIETYIATQNRNF